LSYRGSQKGHYGDNSKRSRFSWGRLKKQKEKEVIYMRDPEPEPKVAPETIVWTPRPLAPGVRVFLSKPTTLSSDGCKVLLTNDLTQQNQLAYQIALLAESQKLGVEVLTPEGATLKYKVIKIVDQKPEDKAVSFADMAFIGNLKSSLKPNGYTLIAC